MPKFPLDLKSNIILVDATFTSNHATRRIKMVLDTGASVSSIPYEIALSLGIDPTHSKRRIEIMTASTVEYVPIITIPKVSFLEECFVNNLDVICINLPHDTRASGLLGLNALRHFDVLLKFRSGLLEITR